MRLPLRAAIIAAFAIVGCTPPPVQTPDSGPPSSGCPAGLACRPACTTAADCLLSETCTQSVCAARPPSASQYAACAIDADCPRGDFCKLGACGHDCLTDRECSSGLVCDNRGRCIAAGVVGQPVVDPPRSQGTPAIAPAAVDFGTSGTTVTLSLSNSGGEPFDFRVLTSQNWLSVTPFEGRVSGQPVDVTVTIDRASIVGTSGAFLTINTTAGSLHVPVSFSSTLEGEWSSSFAIESPLALGTHTFPIHLEQASGQVSGYVDGDKSPVYPINAAVTGAVGGTSSAVELNFTFELAAAAGTTANPTVPASLTRLVEVTVKRTGSTQLAGTFKETIKGLIGTGAVVSGKVAMTRVGPAKAGVAAPPPTYTVPPVADPFVDASNTPRAAYAACHTCPGGACKTAPTDFQLNASAFLNYVAPGQSSPAALLFLAELNSAGYLNVDSCVGGTTPCPNRYDPTYLRCAQYWQIRAAREGNQTSARANFLDLLEVPYDAALFEANAAIARGHDNWFAPTATLDTDAAWLDKAVTRLETGLFTTSGGSMTLADPGAATVLAAFAASSLNHTLPFPSAVLIPQPRAAGEAVRRALTVGSTLLLATNDLAFILRKKAAADLAREKLRRSVLTTYYLAAGLGQVVAVTPGTWTAEVAELAGRWEESLGALGELDLGRNAFGYAPAYVPFFWKSTGATAVSTNFEQIDALAVAAAHDWTTAYATATGASRQFEQSQVTLDAEFGNQVSSITLQLEQLCGPSGDNLTLCGQSSSSEVAQLALETTIAGRRVEAVVQQAQNIHSEVAIEEDRAAAIAGVHQNNAQLIRETGQNVAIDDAQIEFIGYMQQNWHNVAQAIGSASPRALIGALLGGVVDAVAGPAKMSLEADKAALATDERARIEFSAASTELINSAATIKTKHLQLLTLKIEQDISILSAAQAAGRLLAAYSRAQSLVAEKKRLQAVAGANGQHALTYRVFSTAAAKGALTHGADAQRWAYLAGRALEYQLNQSINLNWQNLWKVRAPADLDLFLAEVRSASGTSPTSQTRMEIISLRDRILRIGTPTKDLATGATVTPQDRFHHFVATPANRDVDGNFHIRFSTVDGTNPIFSSTLASDRVYAIRINLVGNALGAGVTSAQVRLVHGGMSYLRALTKGPDGIAPLTPYDVTGKDNRPTVATIQAGINAPAFGNTLQDNTELRERAVLATGWELVIDQTSATPGNAALDLSGLDDIELVFTHDAYTIQ